MKLIYLFFINDPLLIIYFVNPAGRQLDIFLYAYPSPFCDIIAPGIS